MTISEAIKELERRKNNTRYALLVRVCQKNFRNGRIAGSHHIFKTPWKGDPRINLQKQRGTAKPYQVEQVLEALRKLQEMEESKKQDSQSLWKGE